MGRGFPAQISDFRRRSGGGDVDVDGIGGE